MNDKLIIEKMLAESLHEFKPKKYKDMPYDYLMIEKTKNNRVILQIAFHKATGKLSHFDIEIDDSSDEWHSID